MVLVLSPQTESEGGRGARCKGGEEWGGGGRGEIVHVSQWSATSQASGLSSYVTALREEQADMVSKLEFENELLKPDEPSRGSTSCQQLSLLFLIPGFLHAVERQK